MSPWHLRIIVIALLAAIVGVPLAMTAGRTQPATHAADAPALVIMTPHNEQIRHEFAAAFNRWRSGQGLDPVYFDWRISGGTSDLRKAAFAQFEAKINQGKADDGIGCDLFFGGGEYEHSKLARGIDGLPLTVPVKLPDGLLEHAFAQSQIGGEPLYHDELRWVGIALASFGIVYNRQVLEQVIDTPPPVQWADLAAEPYFRWIALADPAHSGSIAATYNAILRRLGWNDGWRTLRRVFANARYFTSSASKVPVDVSAGEAAAGMCIDFYGRFQAGAVGGERVGYIDPKFTTAINADPISIFRGAPHHDLANQFVVWLLSPPAQQLWQLQRGRPDGPELFELRRLPVRRDVYTQKNMARWTDHVDPFELARPFPDAMPNFYSAVAPISHAIAIDIHDDLQAAWGAIIRQADPSRRDQMLAVFEQMPPDLTVTWPNDQLAAAWPAAIDDESHPDHETAAAVISAFYASFGKRMKDPRSFLEDRLRWTLFFRDQYRQVAAMADDG